MSTTEAKSSSGRWLAGCAVIFFVLIGVVGAGIEDLLLGWIYFPLSGLPKFTIDWPAAAVGLTSLVGFIAALHIALRWFAHALPPAENQSPRHWQIRSTITIAMIVLLMFTTGIAMVGLAHQSVWMFFGRSNERVTQAEQQIGVIASAQLAERRYQEGEHLKRLALGIMSFHDVFQELPPGGMMTEEGELLHGWPIIIGPYFFPISNEQVDFSTPWNQPPNDRLFKCNFPTFVNPAISGPHFDSQGYGVAHVAANLHVLPIRTIKISHNKPEDRLGDSIAQLYPSKQSISNGDIHDGTSNTILLATVAENFKPWGHPANVRDPGRGINRHSDGFGGPPQWNGAMFSFCDGHTQFVNAKADPRVLQQLATPAGREPATADDLPGR